MYPLKSIDLLFLTGNRAPEFMGISNNEPILNLWSPLNPGSYLFRNLDVHLGQRSEGGSEHSLNGMHSHMEVSFQIMHLQNVSC